MKILHEFVKPTSISDEKQI